MSSDKSSTSIVIANVEILQDAHGRYSLNTLHKASGAKRGKEPSQWLQNKTTQELIAELQRHAGNSCFDVVRGGNAPGIYAHELLAISYAGWISPRFQLLVNQTFADVKRGGVLSVGAPPTPVRIKERPEVSEQLASIWLTLKRQDLSPWITSKDLAAYAGVSHSTARHHAKYLFDLGLLDVEEATPHFYRLSEVAAKRNPGAYQRLDKLSDIIKTHRERHGRRWDITEL